MNFTMNEEQKRIRKIVIRYIRDNINVIGKAEENRKIIWEECAKGGLLSYNCSVPGEGADFDVYTQMIITEAFGYACEVNGLVYSWNQHLWGCQKMVEEFADAAVKNKYLPQMISGRKVGSCAFSEKSKVIYEEKEDGFVLNGSAMVSAADLFLVFAQSGEDSPGCVFLVEKDFDGVVLSEDQLHRGQNGCAVSELLFRNCLIPKENLLGKKKDGIHIMNRAMELTCFFESVAHLGAMKRFLKRCLEYIRTGEHSGYPSSSFPFINSKIAKIRLHIELAKNMSENIIKEFGKGSPIYMKVSMFHYFVSEKFVEWYTDAMCIYSAYGYPAGYGFEQELREALGAGIYVGSNEMQSDIIYQMSKNEVYD